MTWSIEMKKMSRQSEIDKIEKIINLTIPFYDLTPHPDKTFDENRAIAQQDKIKRKELAQAIVDSDIGTKDRFEIDYEDVDGLFDEFGAGVKPIDYSSDKLTDEDIAYGRSRGIEPNDRWEVT